MAETKQDKGKDRDKEQQRRITSRAADEASGLMRGVALAGVEAVRATGSAISSFADTVSQRNRPEEKDSSSDLTRDLPRDMYSGFLNAVEQFLEIPGKVIDKMQDSYKETKDTRETKES